MGFEVGAASPRSADWTAVAINLNRIGGALVVLGDNGDPLTGVTVPYTVMVDWTSVGPLFVSSTHTRDIGAGVFTIDRVRRTARDVTALLTVTGTDGVLVDTQMDFGQTYDTNSATLNHEG